MPAKNRPKKPRRKQSLQGIKCVFSAGRWRWRACVKVAGKQTVGQLRETQEQAHADYLELRRTLLPVVGREAQLGTLGDALDAYLEERERTDSSRAMFTHRSQAKYLLGAWPRELPLSALELEYLQAFVDGAVRQGRNPNTVRKDLHLLRRLFARAGLAFPEGLAIPPAPRPQTHYLEPEEFVELVQRIRSYRGDLDKLGRRKVVRQQERDAALVMFLGCTGIRLGWCAPQFPRTPAKGRQPDLG
ncbi:MAG: hypothetical protein ACYS26_10155 [Planctomycetota bacterium]|jgi:integrase